MLEDRIAKEDNDSKNDAIKMRNIYIYILNQLIFLPNGKITRVKMM